MINIPRWEQRLNSYGKVLNRLAEVVNESKKRELNAIEKDGLVQRFEFTHELAWKLMKSYAEYQGYEGIAGSRDASRRAFEMELITNGQAWMDMMKSRNETSHNYDGTIADTVVNDVIGRFYNLLLDFYNKMQTISVQTPMI